MQSVMLEQNDGLINTVGFAGEPALDERIMLCLKATVTSFDEQESKAFKRLTKAKAPRWPDLKTQAAAQDKQRQLTLQQAQLNITDASVRSSADSQLLETDAERGSESSAAGDKQSSVEGKAVLEECEDVSAQKGLKHGTKQRQERRADSTVIAMRELTAPSIHPNVQPGDYSGDQNTGPAEHGVAQLKEGMGAEMTDNLEVSERASATMTEHSPSTSTSASTNSGTSDSSDASSNTSSTSSSSSTQQAGLRHDQESGSHTEMGGMDLDTEGGIAMPSSEEMRQLACRVDLRIAINVPAPLNVVPSPLLSYAGVPVDLSESIANLCRGRTCSAQNI